MNRVTSIEMKFFFVTNFASCVEYQNYCLLLLILLALVCVKVTKFQINLFLVKNSKNTANVGEMFPLNYNCHCIGLVNTTILNLDFSIALMGKNLKFS